MPGVSYGLYDFVSGRPLVDLPVMAGASWTDQLNRPDELSVKIDMRDPDNLKLDLRSASEPNKTVMAARTDDGTVLAWGLIPDDGRTWDEDARTLSLKATGILSSWLEHCIIAPASALTADLYLTGGGGIKTPNPALDTNLSGWSHGTIAKKLLAQRLAWPGAPTVFDLPPDEVGTRQQSYAFPKLKSIGSALTDLSQQDNGPDFAFDARIGPDGLTLRYGFRHGSEAVPRIGTDVGTWSLAAGSPVSKLMLTDAQGGGASASWMTAGRSSDSVLISRARRAAAVTADGYPPFDVVDTSHGDVSVQATLDSYNAVNMAAASRTIREVGFTVRGDASPGLGQFRTGDRVTIDIPSEHPWHPVAIPVRITSVNGNEVGDFLKIGCVILDAP